MDGAESVIAQREASLKQGLSLFRTLAASSTSALWKPVQLPHSATNVEVGKAGASAAEAAGLAVGKAGSVRGLQTPTKKRIVSNQLSSSPSSATLNAKLGEDEKLAFPGSGSDVEEGLDGEALPFRLLPEETLIPVVHRRSNPTKRAPDVFRAVMEVPFEGGPPDLDTFRSVLVTPDARSEWDPLVESAELIEMPDSLTRITKTNYRLGWPASPRDAIAISRTLRDQNTLVDVSTSLNSSPDAPAYLRPSPPYVRSHVHLFAWCVQLPPKGAKDSSANKIKVTAYWSWDLKGAWSGLPAGGLGNQLHLIVRRLVNYVANASHTVASIRSFGRGVDVEHASFDTTRDTLAVDYSILGDEAAGSTGKVSAVVPSGALELDLPSHDGWDIKIKARIHTSAGSSRASTEWECEPMRAIAGSRIHLRIMHEKLHSSDEVARVSITAQRVAVSAELRVNGDVVALDQTVTKPASATVTTDEKAILSDAANISAISIISHTSQSSTTSGGTVAPDVFPGKPSAQSSAIDALIRRNYIYFTSLLQEPEAKWKRVVDSRGVTITQLDSIDPTLVVYRAEATFVGVGVWDLFSIINSPGTRQQWDKGTEESTLIKDVNDLSSLWWNKTKAAWPVSARDSVTVQTSYKSPASVHIFSFSTEDRALFPEIPNIAMGTIRTQVDLRGWSVESLSPTTVHITLLEQSDPKGWTSKSSLPASMTAAVAGVGEYAIKHGGPPVVTRLLGAKGKSSKYDHGSSTFRFEYELASSDDATSAKDAINVECELRCDVETWSANLDLVIDPPPINVMCLRRHKLSQGGSGLWLTIEHAAASLEDDLARVTVRKGNMGKEKGLVLVNGVSIKVDADELQDDQLQELFKKKRSRPQRVPLDLTSPSYLSASLAKHRSSPAPPSTAASSRPGTPARTHNSTMEPSRPATPLRDPPVPFATRSEKHAMSSALDVLFLLRRVYAERSPDPSVNPAGWALVSERNGLFIRRKLMQSLSPTVLVQRSDKVVQGLAAEDILNAVSSLSVRRSCDDRIESITRLESYGNGAGTFYMQTKPSFPFRGRAFYVAHLAAKTSSQQSEDELPLASLSKPVAYFYAAASFAESSAEFPAARLNPTSLPVGRVLVDGWILETLDPYASSAHQIPSTRMTHITAIDYGGALPSTVNTSWNTPLPRTINQLESSLKSRGIPPAPTLPPPALLVAGDGRDESSKAPWVLDEASLQKVLLQADFDPMKRLFTAMIVRLPPGKVITAKEPTPKRLSAETTGLLPPSRPPSVNSSRFNEALDRGNFRQRTESTVSRATSIASLSSAVDEARKASSARKSPPRMSLWFETEVELTHYPRGYEVSIYAFLRRDLKSKEKDSKDEKSVFDLDANQGQGDSLPVLVTVHDLPPSALLAASLDAGSRGRKHLIRVRLAEEELKQRASQGDETLFRLEKECAFLKCKISPRDAGLDTITTSIEQLPSSGASTPSEKIVLVNGERTAVVHVNQTSAMLQREDRDADKIPILRKVMDQEDESAGSLDYVPTPLTKPVAARTHLKQLIVTPESLADKATAVASSNGVALEKKAPSTEATSDADLAATGVQQATPITSAESAVSAATSQIMSILSNYPLSRLGSATTAVNTSSVTATTTNQGKEETSTSQDAAAKAASADQSPITELLTSTTCSLSTVILVAIIFFLLGSLVRSLQSPADFIFLPPVTKNMGSAGALARELSRFLADVNSNSAGVPLREIKRLIELRKVAFGRDLIIALAQRD